MNSVFLTFVLVAVFVSNISCLSEDERLVVRQDLQPVVKTCLEECDMKHVEYENDDIHPCLKKCFVKQFKVLDAKGQLDRNILHELFVKYIHDKTESMSLQKVYEECFDEGNKDVTEDSEAETKRIEVIFKCLRVINEA